VEAGQTQEVILSRYDVIRLLGMGAFEDLIVVRIESVADGAGSSSDQTASEGQSGVVSRDDQLAVTWSSTCLHARSAQVSASPPEEGLLLILTARCHNGLRRIASLRETREP